MFSKKGTAKSQEETLWFIIKIAIMLIGMVVLIVSLLEMEAGCSRHDENPSACVSDENCRPAVKTFDLGWGLYGFSQIEVVGEIECRESVRKPNTRYHAAQDGKCVCPGFWNEIMDRDHDYFGVCYTEYDGEEMYYPCQYGLDVQAEEIKDRCDTDNGLRMHGEVWGSGWNVPDRCCDDGEVKKCGIDKRGETCADHTCKSGRAMHYVVIVNYYWQP